MNALGQSGFHTARFFSCVRVCEVTPLALSLFKIDFGAVRPDGASRRRRRFFRQGCIYTRDRPIRSSRFTFKKSLNAHRHFSIPTFLKDLPREQITRKGLSRVSLKPPSRDRSAVSSERIVQCYCSKIDTPLDSFREIIIRTPLAAPSTFSVDSPALSIHSSFPSPFPFST